MPTYKSREDRWNMRVDSKWITITILLLLFLGVLNIFIQDDAFITFRYAENWVKHHELTWNPGERPRVEGYTNFLWTILMTLPILLNWDPVISSQILGLACILGTLIAVYRLSMLITRSSPVSWLTLILIGTNYSFSAYATGGLETSLQVLLITTGVYITLLLYEKEEWDYRSLGSLSIICGLALLTRLDSVIPFGVLYLSLFWKKLRQPSSRNRISLFFISLIVPAFVMVGTWFIWKVIYYGEILPNSFYVKASHLSFDILKRGFFYIYAFLRSYFLMPVLVIALVFLKKIFLKPKDRILLIILVVWCLYVIRVGGDFMEFRFLVPILPLAFILASSLFASFKSWTFIAFSILVIAGSLNHYLTFTHYYEIEPISALNGHIVNANEDWAGIGKALNQTFGESDKPVVIATRAAGAIPYYAKLQTIDMLGLNDKWIARHGVFGTTRPGHQKRATLQYLLERETHLVIGHPKLLSSQEPSKMAYSYEDLLNFGIYKMSREDVPLSSKVLELPINDEFRLPILYLCQHDFIDKIVKKNKYKIMDIHL